MLVVMRDEKTKALTVVGAMLAAAGLGFLPDAFNVDDGVVGKAEQQAILDHPNLDNQAWKNFGILYAAKLYAADHPAFSKLHDGDVSPTGPDHPIANAVHEELHGTPKPVYIDLSDPEAAQAERDAADAKKAAELADAGKQASPDDLTSENHKCAECGTEFLVKKGDPVVCPECAKGKPSSENLDAVADEEEAKEATGEPVSPVADAATPDPKPNGKRKPKPVAGEGAEQK